VLCKQNNSNPRTASFYLVLETNHVPVNSLTTESFLRYQATGFLALLVEGTPSASRFPYSLSLLQNL
jgi:hypothetical protein